MDFRNPKFNAHGGVDVEINHSKFGWIPFTASAEDIEAHGRDIHSDALAAGPAAYVAPPPPDPSPPPAPDPVREALDILAAAAAPEVRDAVRAKLGTTREALEPVAVTR